MFCAISPTHNTVLEGGRKTHILDCENWKILCGRDIMGSFGVEINKEWLDQPDPDGEVCKQCKKKAYKKLY